MILCTTRGYILQVWGNFGGTGKYSDENIWKKIMKEAVSGGTSEKIIEFFEKLRQQSELAIVVDRGESLEFQTSMKIHAYIV